MAKIESYALRVAPVSGADKLIGTDSVNDNATKNFSVQEIFDFVVKNGNLLQSYVNNAAALAGGLIAGNIYRTSTGEIRIVV
jgi:hypothetical protein